MMKKDGLLVHVGLLGLMILLAGEVRGEPPGTKKWDLKVGIFYGDPAVAEDGTIYVGSEVKKLWAVKPDGTKKWEFATRGTVQTPSVGPDGTIYFGTVGGEPRELDRLYAVNPDGTKKWEFAAGGSIQCCPAVGPDGTIYFRAFLGPWECKFYAVTPEGKKKWEFSDDHRMNLGGSFSIDPGGKIYLGNEGSTLYALDQSGKKKWQFLARGAVDPPALGPDGTIYLGSWEDDHFYAIGPDGKEKWNVAIKGKGDEVCPVLDANGTIYVMSSKPIGLPHVASPRHLNAIKADGAIKWQCEFPPTNSLAVGSDGVIYMGAIGGLLAIDPNGAKIWSFELGHNVVAAGVNISPDGTVYFHSNDGKLYAIRSSSKGLARSSWPMRNQNPQRTSFAGSYAQVKKRGKD